MPNIQQGINQLLGVGAAGMVAYRHSPQGQAAAIDKEANRLEKVATKADSTEIIEQAYDLKEKAYQTYPTAKRYQNIDAAELSQEDREYQKQQKALAQTYGLQRGIEKGQEKLRNSENVKYFQSTLIDPKTEAPLIGEIRKGGNK